MYICYICINIYNIYIYIYIIYIYIYIYISYIYPGYYQPANDPMNGIVTHAIARK